MKRTLLIQPQVKFLGDLQRLECQPGDKFVLMCPGGVTKDMQGQIQALWREFIGNETKLLILPNGYSIGVVAPAQETEEP